MKIENIRIGQLLRLKKERQEAYGLLIDTIKVDGIKPKGDHYQSFWIIHNVLPEELNPNETLVTHWYFKTSDFSGPACITKKAITK